MMTKRARLIEGGENERERDSLGLILQSSAESRASFSKGCRTKACKLSVCAGEYAYAHRQHGGETQSHGLLTQRSTATLNRKQDALPVSLSVVVSLFEKESICLSFKLSLFTVKGLPKRFIKIKVT